MCYEFWGEFKVKDALPHLRSVPDVKTYGDSSQSQSDDHSQHHYDVSDLHT